MIENRVVKLVEHDVSPLQALTVNRLLPLLPL